MSVKAISHRSDTWFWFAYIWKANVLCVRMRILSYSANTRVTWTWPVFSLSTCVDRDDVSWEKVGTRSLNGFSDMETHHQTEIRVCVWHLFAESKLPSYCGCFLPGKDEKGSLFTYCLSLKVIQTLCACVCWEAPLSLSSCGEVTFVLGLAPLCVIFQSTKPPRLSYFCYSFG